MTRAARRATVALCTTTSLLACGAASTAASGEPAHPPAASGAPTSTDSTLAQIDRVVREQFYAPDLLAERRWSEHVKAARRELAAKPQDRAASRGASSRRSRRRTPSTSRRRALATRRCSRSWGRPSESPPRAARTSAACPHALPERGRGRVVEDIDGRWYRRGVLDGGVAEHAGLLLGDEVVLADGDPFSPVASFAGKAGKPVALSVRRSAGGPLTPLTVTPRRTAPGRVPRSAQGKRSRRRARRRTHRLRACLVLGRRRDAGRSSRTRSTSSIRRGSPTSSSTCATASAARPLRTSGSRPQRAGVRLADARREALSARRDDPRPCGAARQRRQSQRQGGDRARREGASPRDARRRAHRRERSPGALFCLEDGAILYLAVGSLTVRRQKLEGRGVTPDRRVPFDVRYAGGRDPQLEAAIDTLSRGLATEH